MPASSPALPTRRPWLAAFAAVNAVAAWGGAVALMSGGIDFGDRLNQRLPFQSLVLAGLALAAVVAIPLTALAWSAWVGSARTGEVALVAGLLLIGWIAVQVVVLRSLSLFHPTYLGVGAAIVAASHRVQLGPLWRGALLVLVGAVVTASGVGLVPHLVKDGLAVLSVLSVVLLGTGVASVAVGGRSALRGRGRLRGVAGTAGLVLVVGVAVSIVAPAVAATHVPPTHVGRTPAALGLAYDPVTLTTADGVELAAWYLAGTNGAGVVVLHGAGSTRSDVLDQAAALVSSGYAALLVDARGHGDSDGTAMDFGWRGDLDIGAATAFLASRTDIDAERIGVVGFSMGGEEAIGAAAAHRRIRAVVAEGATARRAADKAWLSDAYGWRGWVQERLERAQDSVTALLTEASPPTSLRAAVAMASATRFLLITAGNVDDERRAASFIGAGTGGRAQVWEVAGADHTGGYDVDPEGWRERVVGFLDDALVSEPRP